MSTGPQRPCKRPGCRAFAVAGGGFCAAHAPAARAAEAAKVAATDAQRGTSAARGYGSRWHRVSQLTRQKFPLSAGYLTRTEFWTPNLAQHFHTLRVLALERGEFLAFFTARGAGTRFLEEFPIYAFHPSSGPLPSEEVDHIVPVSGPADPLFWAEWNHQAISKGQHSEKTATFDGGFRGGRPAPAPASTSGGIA